MRLGILYAFITTILAAAGWVFTKIALREFEPVSFIAWRFSIAALVMAALCLPQLLAFKQRELLISLGVGLLLGLGITVWVEGMNQVAYIGEGAFIVSLMVVIIPIVAYFFGDDLNPFLLISLLPAVLGLYCLTGADGFQFEKGQLILLGAAVLFSFHIVISTKYTRDIPALPLTTIQLMVGAVLATIWSGFNGGLLKPLAGAFSNLTWAMLLCAALLATSLRFFTKTKSMMLISAHESALVALFVPVWTAIMGVIILSEQMSKIQLMGCALILSAQLIYLFRPKPSSKSVTA